MAYKYFIWFIFLLPIASFAQKEETGYILFPTCERAEDHDLIGCNLSELRKFIENHLEYPEIALDKGYEGKVFIKYILTPDKNIEFSIDKKDKIHPSLTEAALNVANQLKDSINSGLFKVIPRKIKGRVVKSNYRIPINFSLPVEGDTSRKIVMATYRTSEKTVQFRRDLNGNIYAYLLLPKEEKMLIKISGDKDPMMLTQEEQSYFFLYNLTFLKSEILLTLGEIDGKKYELFIDKNKTEEDISNTEKSDMHVKVYSVDDPNTAIETFTSVDQLFSSKYSVLLFK